MTWLIKLYAEQTTPDEVVIFLLLGTFTILVVTFVGYALVLLTLSRWRMNESYSMRQLLFPSAARIRKYSAEYLLGTLTALLLALTVSTKHDAVEAILAENIGAIGYEAIRSALPYGGFSEQELVAEGLNQDTAVQIVAWLNGGVSEPISLKAEDLVRPLLVAGMAENANIIVRKAVEKFGMSRNSILSQGVLLAFAVVLLIGYILWFGFQRWRELQRARTSEPGYSAILRRLSLPAVCIPLLFVSAITLEDEERLVKSAVGSASVPEETTETSIGRVIRRQADTIDDLEIDARDLEGLNESFRGIAARIDDALGQIGMLQTALRDMDQSLGNAHDRLGDAARRDEALAGTLSVLKDQLVQIQTDARALSERAVVMSRRALAAVEQLASTVQPLAQQIDSLERDLRRLTQRVGSSAQDYGLLLVENPNSGFRYFIVPISGSTDRASGLRIGIHALSPGVYQISGDSSVSTRQRVVINGVYTVRLQRPQAVIQ